ncbi:MAG: hypothetical protein QNJ31_07240 [Candidatus Caenarcaniphilales bacterium]|nr:hypothetical protein [Candidatus Caenarcaniphilales bacterium]
MTAGGYNMGGDLDLCSRETEKTKFLASVKKLALTRNVSERTVMLWCYQRAESIEALNRMRLWIEEEDKTERWLMSLPELEFVEN